MLCNNPLTCCIKTTVDAQFVKRPTGTIYYPLWVKKRVVSIRIERVVPHRVWGDII